MIQTILLAAGSSTRMGDVKPLLPYRGEPLVIHALRAALLASSRVVVVTGFYAAQIEEALKPYQETYSDHLFIIRNPNPELGQFSSTICGVRALEADQAFAITMADLPLVTAQHYNKLIQVLAGYEAVRPFCDGVPGHPVLCAANLRPMILSLPTTATMRELLSGRKVCNLEDGDPAWTTDIDTPESYQQLIGVWNQNPQITQQP
jgi:molybdenum cofactor cytidylyltransferase